MRNIFMNHLIKAAEADDSIYLVVGDVGFSVIEKFQEKFGHRYINAGVAEQNMIGIAAGLAMAGKNVFVYSIIPFVTLRCYEQIRNDICYQELPVKLVGVGSGFSYGPMGATHHALEDVALMRTLPGMTVVAPGSKFETEHLVQEFINLKNPGYLRLSNNEEITLYPPGNKPKIGSFHEVIPHDECVILASGNALDLGFSVCKKLQSEGISIGLASAHTVKPIDEAFLLNRKEQLQAIFTIEEHSVIGGLGEAVARFTSENFNHKIQFKAFGVNDFYFHEAGSRAYLLKQANLHVDHIAQEIKKKLDQKQSPYLQTISMIPHRLDPGSEAGMT